MCNDARLMKGFKDKEAKTRHNYDGDNCRGIVCEPSFYNIVRLPYSIRINHIYFKICRRRDMLHNYLFFFVGSFFFFFF